MNSIFHYLLISLLVGLVFIGCQNDNEGINNSEQIEISEKISNGLLEDLKFTPDKIPSYIINSDGTWNIAVICTENRSGDQCKGMLQQFSIITKSSGPYHHYVTIEKDKIASLAQKNIIEWVGERPDVAMNDSVLGVVKIHSQILNYMNQSIDNIPNYVINEDGTWNILVSCRKNISFSLCKDGIRKHGTIGEQRWGSAFEVALNKDNIIQLAEEKTINWIQSAPRAEDEE